MNYCSPLSGNSDLVYIDTGYYILDCLCVLVLILTITSIYIIGAIVIIVNRQNVMILNYEWYRQPCLSTGHCHHYIVMNVLLIAYKTCEPGLLPAWIQHWRSIEEDYYSICRVWSHIEALALSNFSGCWTYMIVSFYPLPFYIPCETFNLTDSQECFTYWLMFTDLFSVPVSGLSCLNTLI